MQLNDTLFDSDMLKHSHSQTLWKKTEVFGGYGYKVDNKGNFSFDELAFSCENMVPIGGINYALQKMFISSFRSAASMLDDTEDDVPPISFGVIDRNIPISSTLDHIHSTTTEVGAYKEASNVADIIFTENAAVCLFGVGIDGANGESPFAVKFNDTNIDGIIPFRYGKRETMEYLLENSDTYYGLSSDLSVEKIVVKKDTNIPVSDDSATENYDEEVEVEEIPLPDRCALYFKRFEDVRIRYRSASTGAIVHNDYYDESNPSIVQSYADIHLKISAIDIREWFSACGFSSNKPFISSIGLFIADGKAASRYRITQIAREVIAGNWGNGDIRKTRLTDAGYDYDSVMIVVNKILAGENTNGPEDFYNFRLFSKINIPPKTLQDSNGNDRDFDIVYRVYGA